jgi:hypothetical protein
LLLAQGLGKLAAPTGYFAALARFRALPTSAVVAVGMAFLATEILSGLGLLGAALNRAPNRKLALVAAVGALAISVGYATLIVQAYVRGLQIDNCTCFGVFLAQRLSPWVIAQEASMLAWTGWLVARMAAPF